MATSVTTSSTKKKKLVYKQDADGVFRLKKVEADTAPKSTGGDNNKAVDDFLDELAECSYRVIDPTKIASEPVIEVADEPAVESEENQHIPIRDENTKPPTTRSKSKQRERKASKGSSPVAQSEKSSGKDSEDSQHLIAGFIDLMLKFNVPSFVLGLVTALVLQRMRPLLTQYAVVGFNALKIGLFWGTIIGAAGWYLGVVKTKDLEAIKEFGAKVKERVTGKPAGEATTVSDEEEYSDEEEPEEEDLEDPMPFLGGPDDPNVMRGMDDQRMSRRPPASSPAKLERKNTLTRVTPFVYSHPTSRDTSRNKSTSDLITQRSKQPSLNRIQTVDPRAFGKRGSGSSMDYMRGHQQSPSDLYRQHSNESGRSTHSADSYPRSSPSRSMPLKKLPPHPHEVEELPFINEVKLMSNEEMEYMDSPQSMPDAPVKRSTSVMSKKSVLGTRANYNKFLANVPRKNE